MVDKAAERDGRPTLTVDVLIPDTEGKVLLIRRGHSPYEGMWCFPGGIVDPGETVAEAAIREVREETGLEVKLDRVLGIYSTLGRDPRGHYISIAFVAKPVNADPEVTEEATAWTRMSPTGKPEMAFDHARILSDLAQRPERGRAVIA
jgi:8-oxo-dGTP diphosphatase